MKNTDEVVATIAQQMAAGQFQSAARLCAQELLSAPSDIPLLALLTAACEHAGEVDKAREVAVCWVQAAPLDAYAHYKLAMIEQRLQNYPAAVDRLQIASNVAGPDDDVSYAAREALRALDAIQLPQILALREVDLCFRLKLRTHMEEALQERGFSLSPDGRRRLASLDDGSFTAQAGQPRLLS